jgi:hypothetical protein
MALTFRKALAIVAKDRLLTTADRAHLDRWREDNYPDDPSWQRLATAARARGFLPPKTIYEGIIREALHMRRYAESIRSGIDFDLRERRQQHERHLELAQKADELAEYYKWAEGYSGIADFFKRFLSPVADLQALHRKAAQLLRQRAGRPPVSAARVSRQDRRGCRTGLRKVFAFIDLAAAFVDGCISEKPDHEAIAVLTEIAFRGYDIDDEDVRKALRPTTQSAQTGSRTRAQKIVTCARDLTATLSIC